MTVVDNFKARHKIRLQGIDAPERTQAFSYASKQHLSELLFGKYVTVIINPAGKYDRWGRIIGKIIVNGEDANLNQITSGLAWHYKKYENEQTRTDRQAYANAEIEARSQKRELWRDPNPTAPWAFRHHATGTTEESDPSDDPTPSSARTGLSQSNQISNRRDDITPQVAERTVGEIRGNKRSRIYHWFGCPNYDDIAPHNRVPFKTREEAEQAGYRAARNCG